MKHILAISACVFLVATPAWVRAQTPMAPAERKVSLPARTAKKAKGKEKFFDFEGLVIDGELRKPGAFFTSAREKVRFDRLLRLRRSFLDQVEKSADDPALRAR